MLNYTQLTESERNQLYALKQAGFKSSAIALQLNQRIARDKKRGGSLHLYVRCRKKRRKRYGGPDRRGQIKNRVSIDKRPPVVDERSRIGDWEADTIIGRRGGAVLVTLVERKSRFTIIAQAHDKRAENVR